MRFASMSLACALVACSVAHEGPDAGADDASLADAARADAHETDAGTDVGVDGDSEVDAAIPGDGGSDAGCGAAPGAPDGDGDGVPDECDVCPTVVDPTQLDLDGDGRGWVCDPAEGLPFAVTTEVAGSMSGGTTAISADGHLLVVSADETVFSARTGHVDPRLSLLWGTRPRVLVVGGATLVTDNASPGASVVISGDVVSTPFASFGNSIRPWLLGDGLLFTAGDASPWSVGSWRPETTPVELGRLVGPMFCDGARGGEPLITSFTSPTGSETVLHAIVDGALVPVTLDGSAIGAIDFVDCGRRIFGLTPPGGEMGVYGVDRGVATLEATTGLSGHWSTTIVESGDGRLAFLSIPVGGVLGAAVSIQDGASTTTFYEPSVTSPAIAFAASGAFVRFWGGTTEFVDRTTGARTVLSTSITRADEETVIGDFYVVLGASRILIADGPTVLLDAPVAGFRSAAVNDDLVALGGVSTLRVWSSRVASELVLPTSGLFSAERHGDSLLIDVLDESSHPVTRAIRVEGDRFVVTDLAGLSSHTLAFPAAWPDPSAWIATTTSLVRVGPDAAGDLVVLETMAGRLGDTWRLPDFTWVGVVRDGAAVTIVHFTDDGSSIVWRGSSGSDAHLGPRGEELSQATLFDGTSYWLCELPVGARAAQCWALEAWPWPQAGGGYLDRRAPSFSYMFDGRVAIIRRVGPPDLTSLP